MMTIYYAFCFFLFGTVLGSFYNVVGYRLPKGESLLYPSSHCTNCNHKLMPWELVPIFSFLFLGGKCSKCKQKISWFYPIFETVSGLLFMLAFLIFGFSYELLIALTFISLILIITISDYNFMIISDEVLIFFAIVLVIEIFFIYGYKILLYRIMSAIIASFIMFLLKKLGDFLFKKESMGGGDIKLLAIHGLVLGWTLALISIFVGAIVGLPFALLICSRKKDHILPFGPFISVATLIMFLSGFNFDSFLKLFGV